MPHAEEGSVASEGAGEAGRYRRTLDRGWLAIVLLFAAAAAALGAFLPRLGVDASTSMLLDEKDPDLAYYNASRALWTNDDEFAIVCCRRADWFTPEGVKLLQDVQRDLEAVPHCRSVVSPLSVPLLRVTPSALFPVATTLGAPGANLEKARAELLDHTVAKGTLVSADGRDVVFLAYLAAPDGMERLGRERDAAIAADDTARRDALESAYQAFRTELRARRDVFVAEVRAVAAKWSPSLEEPVALSGLPIINVNLVEHVSHDLDVFGIAAFALFTLAFAAMYRRLRWTVLPIVTCLLPVLLVLGTMAALGQKLTVVTANLPMLLFVVMLPYTVYVVERYRERRATRPGESHRDSSAGAARDVWVPCLYSCTTTMAGFASLLTSGVKPVWWFGLMMTIGLGIGLACVFLFLPAANHPLRPLDDAAAAASAAPSGVVRWAERLVLRAPGAVTAGAALLLAAAAWGASRVDAENKFIDYFQRTSEVYRGLERIDQRMGGTTPLDVVLTAKEPGWFRTPAGMAAVASVTRYFDSVPEAGCVWSVGTLLEEARKHPALARADLAALSRIPQVEPFLRDLATPDFSRTRVLVRFRETSPTLRRSRILEGLRAHLRTDPALAGVEARPTGVFLLYANMLDALLASQRDTFLLVILVVYAMLVALFRGPLLALVVLVPQALPALVCLGVMGFAGVPLDLITVMVAAVAMGVGIDAAIQYTVRYRIELAATGGDRRAAVTRSHATIGRAIWVATSIMVAGFLVLALSDFVPTVSFGLFNALAMLMGQVAALTVVPALFLLTGLPRR
jgi:uncharacterized protein